MPPPYYPSMSLTGRVFFFFFLSTRPPLKKRAVAAMDSCFDLIGVHQHGIAVGSMNGEKAPCIKDPDDELMSPDDMAARMREVLARPWIGVCVPLALSLSY